MHSMMPMELVSAVAVTVRLRYRITYVVEDDLITIERVDRTV